MHQKIHLHFQCSQPSWQFDRENGKNFCRACRKHVPDLRGESTETILELKRKNGGEACGIFYRDQLVLDARTQKGPSLFRIVLAGMFTTFVAGARLSAQSSVPDSVKTVQVDTNTTYKPQTENDAEKTDSVSTAAATVESKPDKRPLRYRRLNLFWIGSHHYYLSWRFPFLHIRRQFMGKF